MADEQYISKMLQLPLPVTGNEYIECVRTIDGGVTWVNFRVKLSDIGFGGVTSVGLSMPAGFSVDGSPVTDSGTLTVTYAAGYQGYTGAEATRLAGIATGATANATDAALRDRGTHTGEQAQTTITGLDTSLAAKADLVSGKVPTSQLPAISIGETFPAASQAAMLALTAEIGDVAIRSDLSNRKFLLLGTSTTLGDWVEFDPAGGAVTSVNGQTGVVVLGKADIGLPNADDVSDANKPVSTAQAAAIALKGNINGQTWTGVHEFTDTPRFTTAGDGATYLFDITTSSATAPRLRLGTISTPGQYFEVGAWDGKNNFDSKTRALKFFNSAGYVELDNTDGRFRINGVNPVPQSRFLASDYASTSTTRVEVPSLTFPVVSGKKYLVKFKGAYTSAATTTGGSLGFNVTGTGTTIGSLQGGVGRANAGPIASVIKSTTSYQITTSGNNFVGDACHIEGEFVLDCTGSGNIEVQWGSEVAGSTATLLAGSALVVQELA